LRGPPFVAPPDRHPVQKSKEIRRLNSPAFRRGAAQRDHLSSPSKHFRSSSSFVAFLLGVIVPLSFGISDIDPVPAGKTRVNLDAGNPIRIVIHGNDFASGTPHHIPPSSNEFLQLTGIAPRRRYGLYRRVPETPIGYIKLTEEKLITCKLSGNYRLTVFYGRGLSRSDEGLRPEDAPQSLCIGRITQRLQRT